MVKTKRTSAFQISIALNLLAIGLAVSSPARAQGSGLWTNTGKLNVARAFHTFTLLATGHVLVAGGDGSTGLLASAELYNPATGAFTLTGSMAMAREEHTATLLPNGDVLVAGGYQGSDYTAEAELYNPSTGQWKTTGSMTVARGFAGPRFSRMAKCWSLGVKTLMARQAAPPNYTTRPPASGKPPAACMPATRPPRLCFRMARSSSPARPPTSTIPRLDSGLWVRRRFSPPAALPEFQTATFFSLEASQRLPLPKFTIHRLMPGRSLQTRLEFTFLVTWWRSLRERPCLRAARRATILRP